MLKNILCFGDSNTFGFVPACGERYDRNTRWTGLLQKYLGEDYYVIEEGLCGRTTVYDDPYMQYSNGSLYLGLCIATHSPLDLVIVMLGTNDTKEKFGASARDIAEGLKQLVRILRNPNVYNKEILIVSPIHIGDKILVSPYRGDFGGLEAVEKSKSLAAEYKKVAEKYGCYFLDAADYARADDRDAIHMNAEGHKSLAEAIYNKIKEIEKGL
jgi:GDSL-like Lipase/Acylhydrolase.